MDRPLNRIVVAFATVLCGHVVTASNEPAESLLERFLAVEQNTPHQYKALRHFEAHTEKLDKSAWMEVWTEADRAGFRYEVTAEDGSPYIRSKIFREALEAEARTWREGTGGRSSISRDNYEFVECSTHPDELTCVNVKPRRREVMLIEGAIFLDPGSGELVRMEGSLSKNPSFWTRKVDIQRRYQRIGGVSVPVALESTGNVRVAGPSSLPSVHEYESVNGIRVGTPVASRAPFGPQMASR